MKKIAIIPLAREKMQRRRIPVEWVEETMHHPTQTVDGYGGRKVAHGKYMIEGKAYLLRDLCVTSLPVIARRMCAVAISLIIITL